MNNKYISRLSHELKTPLNAILGFAQLLKEDKTNIDEFLDYIIQNSEDLIYLINNFLNFNRLDYFSINKEIINFSNLLKEYIKLFSRKDIQLMVDINEEDIFIYTDLTLLKNILKNLITNAHKHCLNKGIVKIYTTIENNKLWFYIENNGHIPIDDETKIFEPFKKFNTLTGFGLSVIKKASDIINEKIIFDQKDNFVKFKLSLNYIKYRKMKFLYIEDNKFNQILMKNIIKYHILDVKDNAHNFLDSIREYDFLLLDWHLNHFNGKDVVRELRKHNINIPIIVITADTTPQLIQKFTEQKIKYFNKPLNINDFKKYFREKYTLNI